MPSRIKLLVTGCLLSPAALAKAALPFEAPFRASGERSVVTRSVTLLR
jgi:hypothetical protein